ncbi:Serine/threonine-protein kinase PknK [compost metagenome]
MSQLSKSGRGAYPASEHFVQSIADTKVVPPRGARRLVPREQLMARLLEARRQRCVVIQGPAGAGKTSTLLAWRSELLKLNFDVAWLSLAAEDNELTRFSNCLLVSLAEVDSGMVRDASILLGRDSDELAIENWVVTLAQGIAQRRPARDMVLMIDDLQHLEEPRILQILQWLLEYAPPQLHLVLGSRLPVPLPMSLARLRSQGQLGEFDLRDLRFSLEETNRYLCEQLGSIDRHAAERLHELTDGWIAGLQLFALDLKTRQGGAFVPVEIRDPGTFAGYFEREVLARLEGEDLRLLTGASICNRFCASLCASLLGTPRNVPRIVNRLARLDSDNLFITPVKSHDRETWYRLHPLLREVLRARLVQQGPEPRDLHAVARDWFDAHGHVDEAVRHAVLAGDPEAAAGIIEACAEELLARGNIGQLTGLLHRMPVEELDQRLGLRILMAHLQLYARNFAGLERNLEHLQANRERLRPEQRHALTLLHAARALHLDDSEAMRAIFPALQAIPADVDDLTHTGRSVHLAWMHMHFRQFAEARAVLEEGDRPGGSPRRSLIGRCLGGMSLALEGHLTQAEHVFREALAEAEEQGSGYLIVAGLAAGLLATALYEQDQCEAVCQLLEPRIRLLEHTSAPDTVLQVLANLSEALWRLGRHAQADACVERLHDYAAQDGMHRLVAYALFLRMRHLLLDGEPEQAAAVLAAIEALDAGRHGAAVDIAELVDRSWLTMALHQGNWQGASERAAAAIARAEADGRWRVVACLWLQRALAERGAGRHERATAHLGEALRLGRRLGLLRSLLDIAPQVREMLAELRERGELEPVLGIYVQRLLAVDEDDAGKPAAELEPAELLGGLRSRELEVLELVAQAMPNKKIAKVLNLSPETVKWHLKNIYLKLGVGGRAEAIARLRDLKAAVTHR